MWLRAAALGKLFKSTLNNRLHRNLACVIDKSSQGAKLKRAFEELPYIAHWNTKRPQERLDGYAPSEYRQRYVKAE